MFVEEPQSFKPTGVCIAEHRYSRPYARTMTDSADERAALLALLRTRPQGATWQSLTTEVLNCGSARTVWESVGTDELLPDPSRADAVATAQQDLEIWERRGLHFVSVLDDEYPSQLREVHQAPPFLFAAGSLQQHDTAVSVVGSRKASPGALGMAAGVARGLVERGITVLAGLAAGIDAAAHTAALSAGGRTVAIIGTGITRYYPASNRNLQREIATNGLVLSQFWPDAVPTKYTFPLRNAVISGYGMATIVIEASENSGTRIQARLAVEHGRPVILTQSVVSSTMWGRTLVDRPGVHLAQDTAEVIRLIERIRERRAQLPALLSALASAR